MMVSLLTSMNKEVVRKALFNMFTTHGPPKFIHCDIGSSFVCADVIELLKDFGVVETNSIPRMPRQNGLAENANKLFKTRIRKLLSRNSNLTIPYVVNLAVYQYNITPLLGTATSPYEEACGRTPHTYIDRIIPSYVHVQKETDLTFPDH